MSIDELHREVAGAIFGFVNWSRKSDAQLIAEKLASLVGFRKKFEAAHDSINASLVERSIAGLNALSSIEEKPMEAVSAREWKQALVAYRELDDKEKVLYAAIGAFRDDMSPAARHLVKDAFTSLGRYEEAYQVISDAFQNYRGGEPHILKAYAGAYLLLCAYTQRWDSFKSVYESQDTERAFSSLDPKLEWNGEITDALALVGPVIRGGRLIGDFLMLAWWSQFLHCFARDVYLVVGKRDQNTFAPVFEFLKFRGIRIVDQIPYGAKHVYDRTLFWELADCRPERIYDIVNFLPRWSAQSPAQFESAKLKVGLCHTAQASEDKNFIIKRRQLTQANIDRLVENTKDAVQWINLQYNTHDPRMLNPRIASWEDTANVIAGTDIVCSIDTSTMHLAGTLGKETWVPQNTIANIKFAWTSSDKCMVYPTIKVFRSGDFRFDAAIDGIVDALRERARRALAGLQGPGPIPQPGLYEQF